MSGENDTSFIITLPGNHRIDEDTDDSRSSNKLGDSSQEKQSFLHEKKKSWMKLDKNEPDDDIEVKILSSREQSESESLETTSCSKQPLNRAESKDSFESSSSKLMCRICHCEEAFAGKALISPCNCSGTLRYVHQTCLQKWLKISGI
jgi:hypothetical protein